MPQNGEFFGYLCISRKNNRVREFELADFSEIGHVLNDLTRFYNIDSMDIVSTECFNDEKQRFLTLNAERVSAKLLDLVLILNFKSTIEAFLSLKASCKTLVDGECSFEVEGYKPFKIKVKDNTVRVEDFDGEADVKMPYLVAVQKFFSPVGANCNYGVRMSGTAESWFPVPLWFPTIDMI